MYLYHQGKHTRQAHVGLPEGTYEEEHGRQGFFGPVSHIYRTHPPTDWLRFEGSLRPHAYDFNTVTPPDLEDASAGRQRLLYNDDVVLWNLSVAYKFLPRDLAEIRLTLYDVLKQNDSIERNVTETYIEDTRTALLQRFALLTFTWNIRNFTL